MVSRATFGVTGSTKFNGINEDFLRLNPPETREKLQPKNPAVALPSSGPTPLLRAGGLPKSAVPDHWPLVHMSISDMPSG